MSPTVRFAVQFTWTWPVTIILLIIAMIPVYGPLMPPIDGALWPVTSKVTFIEQRATEGGVIIRMRYVKNRDCELAGLALDRHGVPIEMDPVQNSENRLTTRGTGLQVSREWFIAADSLDDMRLRFIHRCNPLWLTVTVAYP